MGANIIQEWQVQYLLDHATLLTQRELQQQIGLCASTISRILKKKKLKAYPQHFRQFKKVEIPPVDGCPFIFFVFHRIFKKSKKSLGTDGTYGTMFTINKL